MTGCHDTETHRGERELLNRSSALIERNSRAAAPILEETRMADLVLIGYPDEATADNALAGATQ